MNQEKIVEISEKLLSRLLEFKNNNQGFTFSLRQRDSPQAKKVKRLEKGQWFQGSDYIYLPLFRKGDSARKIKTIGFVIGNNNNEPTNYIEISFKKGNFSDKEIEFYKELADFFKISLNKENYGYYYFKNVDKFLDENLEFYLITFRNKALELLNKYELTDQYVISENEFQKNLKRITIIKDNNILKVIPTQQNMINDNNMNPISLNQILYGPPGTGKTYNTINRALQIIENKSLIELESEERDALKQRFDHYSNNGQIMFTTFHQSMSYEDFIEGIKPEIEEDAEGGKTVIYEVKKGIFKQIAEEARKIRYQSEEYVQQYTFDDAWNKLIELVKDKISKKTLLKIGSWEYGLSSKDSLKYSSVNSPSQYTFTITKQNILDSYHKKIARPSGAFQKDMNEIVEFMKTEFQLADYVEENEISNKIEQTPKPYVLIIDEINRGNVSQIFGELITLIEEDKRLGKNEALEVILPYSKEKFGVPSNLHIIGTMNTADRSVEALDTALRRRFSFVEMMPEYEALNKIQFDDFHLGELLKTINSRIEALLDRDHTIGHSYFINIKPNDTEALKEAFTNKIIPLLQEYFYHDYEKLALILGEGFVECIEPKESKVEFARWNGKTLEKPETSRLFKIKKLDDNFNILDSIKHLLNRVAI